MTSWLPDDYQFPPVSSALTEPNGLLAVGGDLSPSRLLAAYRQGIFPWFSPGDPLLWWSPDPRMVLIPSAFRCTRSLAKTLRNANYEIRFDTSFRAVMTACANAPREGQNGTWIDPAMIDAYCRLHELGYAHSIETWRENQLVGGLYGVAIGKAFFGESMFAKVRDASKIALAHLCEHLRRHDFGIIDCQMETAHLASLGAQPIARADFVDRLAQLRDQAGRPGPWTAGEINGVFRRTEPSA
jgi:leucyl/phenylalanyl-tRNA--protein transferase